MTHASLFSGIGGFDLAAEWCGMTNVFQVEIDQFCQKVLEKNFPNTKRYGDIKQFDGTEYRGTIDVLSGGFPCQPFSQAGKRAGTEDDRYLWPEMLRVIREIQPQWVVGENVAGLITWNNGLVFEQVCADLEAEGYEVQPLVIPACAVNAPHRRDRIWFVAHSKGIGTRRESRGVPESNEWEESERQKEWNADTEYASGIPTTNSIGNAQGSAYGGIRRISGREYESVKERGSVWSNSPNSHVQHASHTVDKGLQGHEQPRTPCEGERKSQSTTQCAWDEDWSEVATRLCRMDDGLPRVVDRAKRLKALGNAIVPQIAFQIFRALPPNL